MPVRASLPVAAIILFLAAPASATDRIDLAGGGWGETMTLAVAAVGVDPAGAAVRGCPGFAPAEPPALVALQTDGDLFLDFGGATGLLVVRPDGLHVCETPDLYGLTRLAFRGAAAGSWLVSPLAAEAGAVASGVLVASGAELGVRDVVRLTGIAVDPALLPPLLSDLPPDPDAEPAYGEAAPPAGGESAVQVTLRGLVPAEEAGPGCAGLVDQSRPDARLVLAEGLPLLAIRSHSDEADTTLMVIGPDGAVHCGDDQIGYDPVSLIEPAEAGRYAVWAGVYPGGEGRTATLVFSEAAPDGFTPPAGPATLSPGSAPAWGWVGHAEGERTEHGLVISAIDFASDFDPACSGAIDPSRPDFVVTLAAPAPLWLEARSDAADTTLMVRSPSGEIFCNDDYNGSNSALGFDPAEAGDHAVWIGAFGGGDGAEATFVVATEGEGSGQDAAMDANPFEGRDVPSAAAALAILEEDPDFAAFLSYERMEETGPEGFILHGVTLRDPGGAEQPILIARVTVSDLDLAGLSVSGSPDRFALSFEGIDYAALAAAAEAGGPPLPDFDAPAPLSVSLSMLPPDGDLSRRTLDVQARFEGQFGLGFTARVLWPEDASAMEPEDIAALTRGELVEFRLDDEGFLAAALARAAEEMGSDPEQMIADALAELEGALGAMGPFAPDSPRGKLLAALTERLTGLDRPGTLALRISAPDGVDAETAFGALMADEPDPSLIAVEIEHRFR